jgi:hypothetical protein
MIREESRRRHRRPWDWPEDPRPNEDPVGHPITKSAWRRRSEDDQIDRHLRRNRRRGGPLFPYASTPLICSAANSPRPSEPQPRPASFRRRVREASSEPQVFRAIPIGVGDASETGEAERNGGGRASK